MGSASDGALVEPAAPPAAQRQLAPVDRYRIEMEIQRLRASRPRSAAPIALLAVGGGLAVFSGLVTLLTLGNRSERYAWDAEGNRYTYTHASPENRYRARLFGAMTGAGLVLSGIGLGMLIPRAKARRDIKMRIRDLRHSLKVATLSYSLSCDATHAQGRVELRF